MGLSHLNIPSLGGGLLANPPAFICRSLIVCLVSLLLVRLHVGAGSGSTEPHGLISSLQIEYLYTSGLAVRDDFGPGGCSLTPWDTHPPTLIQLSPISTWYLCFRLGSLVSWLVAWPMTGGVTHLEARLDQREGPLSLLSGVGLGLGLIPHPAPLHRLPPPPHQSGLHRAYSKNVENESWFWGLQIFFFFSL